MLLVIPKTLKLLFRNFLSAQKLHRDGNDILLHPRHWLTTKRAVSIRCDKSEVKFQLLKMVRLALLPQKRAKMMRWRLPKSFDPFGSFPS
jgi:hypothetical protein